MDTVKLDEYEYELEDFTNYVVAYLTMESTVDPWIHDVATRINETRRVHIDGRIFECVDYSLERHDPVRGGPLLKLYLIEERPEVVNGECNCRP